MAYTQFLINFQIVETLFLAQMKKVLIDTCIWRRLINKLEFDSRLKLLEYWIMHDYIQLLSPVKLKTEWEKHKNIELLKVQKVVREHANQVKKASLFDFEISEDIVSRAEKRLVAQIELIDRLLQKSIAVEESHKAILTTYGHKNKKQAPFHNKTDSDNDALIIFSVLDYAEKNGVQELYFLSDNHTDFASPLEPNSTIHPDISAGYPLVTIRYFKEIDNCFQSFKKDGLPQLVQSVFPNVHKVRNTILVNKTLPFLDQLNEYIEKRFKEIQVIPRHLFA